jgi:hypothetical protein
VAADDLIVINSFINQMKKANLRQKEITQKALDLGVLSYQTLGEEYARGMNEAGGPQKSLKYPTTGRG